MRPHSEDGALSVDVERLLPDPSASTSILDRFPDHGLVAFLAGVPIDAGLVVNHAPLNDRVSHADIVGMAEMSKSAAKRVQRELALAADWVVRPAAIRQSA